MSALSSGQHLHVHTRPRANEALIATGTSACQAGLCVEAVAACYIMLRRRHAANTCSNAQTSIEAGKPDYCTSHTSPEHSNGACRELWQSTCWLDLSKHNDTQSLGACKLRATAVTCKRVASCCRMELQMARLQVAPALDAWQRTFAAGWSHAFLCQVAAGHRWQSRRYIIHARALTTGHASYRCGHSAYMSGCLLAAAA